MNVHLTLGDWAAQHQAARRVRDIVFVQEQGVPVELEWDDMDAVSVHAVAYDEAGRAVGTGRLLPDGHIGRMAVVPAARGKGIGSAILQALMQHAQQRGDKLLVLHAQTHAAGFYVRHGFAMQGEEFMEAGIPHLKMRWMPQPG